MKKKKKVFVDGPIAPESISKSIANHSSKTDIGAHAIFLGQVRADTIDGKQVNSIIYTAYENSFADGFGDIFKQKAMIKKVNLLI